MPSRCFAGEERRKLRRINLLEELREGIFWLSVHYCARLDLEENARSKWVIGWEKRDKLLLSSALANQQRECLLISLKYYIQFCCSSSSYFLKRLLNIQRTHEAQSHRLFPISCSRSLSENELAKDQAISSLSSLPNHSILSSFNSSTFLNWTSHSTSRRRYKIKRPSSTKCAPPITRHTSHSSLFASLDRNGSSNTSPPRGS